MENKEFLDFESFIRQYFPNYIIDSSNSDTVRKVSLWASRNPEFEDPRKGYYLAKGILLTGDVGTGKTDLFNILRTYLNNYLKSRYTFTYGVVWKFTSDFSKDGYSSLDGQELHNRYYDELCLTDSRTKFPNKEQAMHFGSKLLIGEEIIMLRYNSFKRKGYQTHFSTNATAAELTEIYGERAFSRLTEMCNFLSLTGDDRRASGLPNIYANMNDPKPPMPRGLEGEYEKEAQQDMERHYQDFLENKVPSAPLSIVYTILTSLGVLVASDEDLREIMEEVRARYVPDVSAMRKTATEKQREREAKIWEESRNIAVKLFFKRGKNNNCKSIFGERQVELPDDYAKNGLKSVGEVISTPGTMNGASQESLNQVDKS